MVAQFAVHQRKPPAQCIGQNGLARSIRADNCPLFAAVVRPVCILENEPVSQAEGFKEPISALFRGYVFVLSSLSSKSSRRRAEKDCGLLGNS